MQKLLLSYVIWRLLRPGQILFLSVDLSEFFFQIYDPGGGGGGRGEVYSL